MKTQHKKNRSEIEGEKKNKQVLMNICRWKLAEFEQQKAVLLELCKGTGL